MLSAKVQSSARDKGKNSLVLAFIVSILLHLVIIGGVELGRSLNFWQVSILPKWMQSHIYEEVKKEEKKRLEQAIKEKEKEMEIPLIFIETDPSQAVAEAPKDSTHYSTHNTVAANPNPLLNLEIPKIDGRQEKVPKTLDVAKPAETTLQPTPAPPEKAPEPQPQPQPKPPQPITPPKPQPKPEPPPPEEPKPEPKPKQPDGDLQVASLTPKPQPAQPQVAPEPAPPKKRVRNLAEAKAQKGIIEGPKMKQAGGVARLALDSSLNTRATPFGAYDAAFIAAVQARWFSLLDEKDFARDQSGKVVLDFRLNKDGRILAMRVAEADVSDTLAWLCQRAVLDPAPYAPFPPDLRALLKNDYREVRFTFYYNQ